MKSYCITLLFCFCAAVSCAQSAHDAKESQPAELLKNPSFEEEAEPIRNRRFGPNGEGELFGGYLPAGIIPGWIMVDNREERSDIETIAENLLDESQGKALRWQITEGPATIANVGFQGVEAIQGTQYRLTFWARADKKYKGKVQVGLQNKHDNTLYAQAVVKGKIKKRWKKYSMTFTAHEDNPKSRFVITADKPGTLYFDCVSLVVAD